MYKTVEIYNENTRLASYNGALYVLKRISIEDMALLKRLIGLNHPHIVKFYGFYEEEGVFYVVEEFINGVTLGKYLSSTGALNEETVNNIASSICTALIKIHSLGIVHRDINPNNIMIDNNGIVKIIDFGISRINRSSKSADTHILGTHGYAAPEQYGFSETNAKADIYSLGVLINYMLTLRMPNEKIADGYFASIILKCIEIDEHNRYSSAEEVLGDIAVKRKRNHIIRTIPGFRNNKTSEKIIAVAYYIFLLLLELCALDMGRSRAYEISCFFWVFLMFGAPVFLAFDAFNYLDYLPFTRHKTKSSRTWWKFIFISISVILAIVIIILSPNE